jgi:hypothetical protein
VKQPELAISLSAPDQRFPGGIDLSSVLAYCSALSPGKGLSSEIKALLPGASDEQIALLECVALLSRFQRVILELPPDTIAASRKSLRSYAARVRRAAERFALELDQLATVEQHISRLAEPDDDHDDIGFNQVRVPLTEATVVASLVSNGVNLQMLQSQLQRFQRVLLETESTFKGPEGARPKVQRRAIARATALLLHEAGDPLPKHRDSVFARVLAVVLQAAGEELPEDLFDVLKDAIDAVHSGRFTLDHLDTWIGRLARMAAPYASGPAFSTMSETRRVHLTRSK